MALFNSDEYPGDNFAFKCWEINTDRAKKDRIDDKMLLAQIANGEQWASVGGTGLLAELCKRFEATIENGDDNNG